MISPRIRTAAAARAPTTGKHPWVTWFSS